MCNRQGMFFVDVQALVMNGKPLDRKAFEKGQQLARAKRAINRSSQAPQTKNTKHHTESDSTTLRTTTRGGRGKVGHSNRTFKKELDMSKRKNALWNCKNPYQGRAPKILCVCSAGLLRSPTIAKELLLLGYNTRSCGCQDYALIPIDEVLIEWADVVVFADKEHKATVDQTQCLSGKEIYILDIPDNFGYNDPTLVQIIQDKLKERGFQKI